jgi:hypothetical protein
MQFRYSRLEVQELLELEHSGESSGIWKLFEKDRNLDIASLWYLFCCEVVRVVTDPSNYFDSIKTLFVSSFLFSMSSSLYSSLSSSSLRILRISGPIFL